MVNRPAAFALASAIGLTAAPGNTNHQNNQPTYGQQIKTTPTESVAIGRDLGQRHPTQIVTGNSTPMDRTRLIGAPERTEIQSIWHSKNPQGDFHKRLNAAADTRSLSTHSRSREKSMVEVSDLQKKQTTPHSLKTQLPEISFLKEDAFQDGPWEEMISLPTRDWSSTDSIFKLKEKGYIRKTTKYRKEKTLPARGFHAVYNERENTATLQGLLRNEGIHLMQNTETGEISLYIEPTEINDSETGEIQLSQEATIQKLSADQKELEKITRKIRTLWKFVQQTQQSHKTKGANRSLGEMTFSEIEEGEGEEEAFNAFTMSPEELAAYKAWINEPTVKPSTLKVFKQNPKKETLPEEETLPEIVQLKRRVEELEKQVATLTTTVEIIGNFFLPKNPTERSIAEA